MEASNRLQDEFVDIVVIWPAMFVLLKETVSLCYLEIGPANIFFYGGSHNLMVNLVLMARAMRLVPYFYFL